ncbi:MAG: helix-turn-helix transcriptional regulator [Synergistaceae bacterium]|nr:helix-turn-helix transcriptional regulator [Synergistaceae bacterium]
MSSNDFLAQRLRELRKKAGLTQEELAEYVDVHLNTISRWENGIDTPKTFKIKRLAEALHVSETELLNGPNSQTWELRMVVSKTGDSEGGTVDMTGTGSTATLSIGDTAMAITLSADYTLWEDDTKFEALMEDLRRKRQLGLRTRKEGWQ